MGGHPYWYIVSHEKPQKALEKLREREFKAGRYYPAVMFPRFPITPKTKSPGAQHESIEEAMEAADADGTRSILDIAAISATPEFLSASPLGKDVLKQLFGTTTPSRKEAEGKLSDILHDIERGHAVYIELYENNRPAEILFAGYSVD
jgi:hypothetical protein